MKEYYCKACGDKRAFSITCEYGYRTLRQCPTCDSVQTFEKVTV